MVRGHGKGDEVKCSVEDCESPVKSRLMCSAHYHRWVRYGDATILKRIVNRGTLEERFWARVIKDGPLSFLPASLGRCWIWTGSLTRSGYGILGVGQRSKGLILAHRLSYQIAKGPIPEGLHIDHLCMVRPCVNPTHLEAVTQRENNRRASEVKRLRAQI